MTVKVIHTRHDPRHMIHPAFPTYARYCEDNRMRLIQDGRMPLSFEEFKDSDEFDAYCTGLDVEMMRRFEEHKENEV